MTSCTTSGTWPPTTGTDTTTASGTASDTSLSEAGEAVSAPSVTADTGPPVRDGAGTHSSRSSDPPAPAPRTTTGGSPSVSDSTDSTGSPAASATASDNVSAPVRTSRARTTDAPAACSDTPDHATGTNPRPSARTTDASSAGCRPKPAASVGSTASTKVS
ncbi:hypothetical protein ACIGW6_37080, partial [Kitasatospora aureofaciens]